MRKQGLLSVGIGGRESRSGCLDVEKGESLASWHLQDGEEGADMREEGEDRGRLDIAWEHPASADCSISKFLNRILGLGAQAGE